MKENFVCFTGIVARPPRLHEPERFPPFCIIDIRMHSPMTDKFSDYHNCVCFGPLAKRLVEEIQMDMWVLVLGKLHMARWPSKDGKMNTKTQVLITDIALARKKGVYPEIAKILASGRRDFEGVVDTELGI